MIYWHLHKNERSTDIKSSTAKWITLLPFTRGVFNRPSSSSLVPLFCETFHMKISSACSFIFMQIKVIFTRVVSHLNPLFKKTEVQGTRSGLLSVVKPKSNQFEWFLIECRKAIGFAFATLHDWFKNSRHFFIQLQVRAKPIARVFPRFASASCNFFVFWLTHCFGCGPYDWLE